MSIKNIEQISKRYETIKLIDQQIEDIQKMALRIADGKFEEVRISLATIYSKELQNKSLLLEDGETTIRPGETFIHPFHGPMTFVGPRPEPNVGALNLIVIMDDIMSLKVLQLMLDDLKNRRELSLKSVKALMKKGIEK